MHIDFCGVATLIGAIAGFITVVGSFVMQVINWLDQRRSRKEQEKHKEMLEAISKQVGVPTNAVMADKSG